MFPIRNNKEKSTESLAESAHVIKFVSISQWFGLKAKSNRRNSDPDYDIPRSHKPHHSLKQTSELLINNYFQNDNENSKNVNEALVMHGDLEDDSSDR